MFISKQLIHMNFSCKIRNGKEISYVYLTFYPYDECRKIQWLYDIMVLTLEEKFAQRSIFRQPQQQLIWLT